MHKFNELSTLYREKIDPIIEEYLYMVSNIKEIEETMNNQPADRNLVEISSILLVLSKAQNYSLKFDLEDIIHEYMKLLNKNINKMPYIRPSFYGGLSTVGYSVYMISKVYPYYKKVLLKLNKLIVDSTYKLLNEIKQQDSAKAGEYDLISGLSGISMYLLNFEEDYIKLCIEHINEYLVDLIKEREIYGEIVPGIHIPSQNQDLVEDKEFYKKGNFNFSLSHGICGPLVALSLAYKRGISVENQKESIKNVLNMMEHFKIESDNSLYWNGILSFEEFVNFDSGIYSLKARDSWCYGVPGIARSIYIASKAVDSSIGYEMSIRAFNCLCYDNNPENWKLNSPTICHGFSGMIIILGLMLLDEDKSIYLDILKLAIDRTISFYDVNNKYLFLNIENTEEKIEYEDNLDFLTGTSGIIISLLFIREPNNTMEIFRILGLI